MDLLFGGYSSAGILKSTNQDSLFIKGGEGGLTLGVICDGVGGLDCGEVAASGAVCRLKGWYENARQLADQGYGADPGGLCLAVERLNLDLIAYSAGKGLRMGTTLSALLIQDDQYHIIHLGDSRIYLFDGSLIQLTPDHVIDLEHGENGTRQALAQCLGQSESIHPYRRSGTFCAGNGFLLCSDGYYRRMKEAEVRRALRRGSAKSDLNAVAEHLSQKVMKRKETDNVSLGIIMAC